MISATSISPPRMPSKLPDPFVSPSGSGISKAGLLPGLFLIAERLIYDVDSRVNAVPVARHNTVAVIATLNPIWDQNIDFCFIRRVRASKPSIFGFFWNDCYGTHVVLLGGHDREDYGRVSCSIYATRRNI